MPLKVAILKNWRKFGFEHVQCGFIQETDWACFGKATLTFGNGAGVDVQPDDVIITDIDAERIPE